VKLYCATTNPGKVREFRMAAEHFGFPEIDIEVLPGLTSVSAPEENGHTFEDNAVAKAVYYSRFAELPVFADDSGLEVDALGGAPGVYSARYAGEGCTDADNNRLLRANLQGRADRSARFVCVIALAEKGRLLGTFRGAVEGRMIDEERGGRGFGYDPMFFHEPFGATFGEASDERKMSVSHRGQALRAMLDWCRSANRR
jgi:XTP/dITP diphosphohydrolase